jgi:hypothetical protein
MYSLGEIDPIVINLPIDVVVGADDRVLSPQRVGLNHACFSGLSAMRFVV